MICDRCGREVEPEEAWPGTGEWEGATLCPDCHLETEEDADASTE